MLLDSSIRCCALHEQLLLGGEAPLLALLDRRVALDVAGTWNEAEREALVKAKIEGGEVERTPTSTKTSGEVVDLLAALQRSVDAAKKGRGEDTSEEAEEPAEKAAAKKTTKKTAAKKATETVEVEVEAAAPVIGPDGKKVLPDVPDEQFEKDVAALSCCAG